MRILSLTDLHGLAGSITGFAEPLAEADVVLLTGDITHFGRCDQAAAVVDAVRAHNPRVLGVHGNCDGPEVATYLAEEGMSLDGRHVEIDGVTFVGVGGSLPCPAHTPNERDEDQLAACLEAAADDIAPDVPLVLVAHQPPQGTALDLARGGRHVGSFAVREFIERRRPLVAFSGHIHEGRGADRLGPTALLNPGPARYGGYGWAEVERGALVVAEVRHLPVRR
jgi:Icc-related predicted phosphoesterase